MPSTARLHLTTLALCTALATAGASAAALDKGDKAFMEKAAAGGLFEVEAGKLAQEKGQGDGVKAFGAMLTKDHGAANDELKSLAGKKEVKLPDAMLADHKKTLDKLAKAKDFDKAFIKEVGLHDHAKDIALFEKEAKSGKDADVKAFAEKALPTLRKHREEAEKLAKAKK